MIKRLALRNFRGVEKGILGLSPLTILMGPNNAGKSSALEALFLAPNPSRETRYAYDSPLRTIETIHRTGEADLEPLFLFPYYLPSEGFILCEFEDESVSLLLLSAKGRMVEFDSAKIAEPQSETLVEELLSTDNISSLLPLKSLDMKREVGRYSRGGGSWSNELLMGEALFISSDISKEAYRSYLPNHWTEIVNQKVGREIVKDLNQLVNERGIDLLMEPFFSTSDITPFMLLEDGRRIRLGDMGEGWQVLFLAMILQKLIKPEILLWDDIEAHMNPKMLSFVARWILTLIEGGTQVLLSTHSIEAVRIIAGLTEEVKQNTSTILLLSLQQGELKARALSLDEIERLERSGVDVRISERFLM